MEVRLELVGTAPLLMHNCTLVNPDHPIAKEISSYTSKRKKTEEDRRAVARLEWNAALYQDEDGRVVMPTANVRRCLINAAKITRQGKQVERALLFCDFQVPLVYEGSDDAEILFKDPTFVHEAAVGVGTSRVIRTRPRFMQWAVVANAILLEQVLDFADLKEIAIRAGQSEGLGDNRTNGFGRFKATVVAL